MFFYVNSQKHLAIFLNTKLISKEYLSNNSNEINKFFGLLRNLQTILCALNLQNHFRPLLNYRDHIYTKYITRHSTKESNLCNGSIKSSFSYLLHCFKFSEQISSILNNIKNSNSSILETGNYEVIWILLFEDTSFNDHTNTCILESTIKCIILIKSFNQPE